MTWFWCLKFKIAGNWVRLPLLESVFTLVSISCGWGEGRDPMIYDAIFNLFWALLILKVDMSIRLAIGSSNTEMLCNVWKVINQGWSAWTFSTFLWFSSSNILPFWAQPRLCLCLRQSVDVSRKCKASLQKTGLGQICSVAWNYPNLKCFGLTVEWDY